MKKNELLPLAALLIMFLAAFGQGLAGLPVWDDVDLLKSLAGHQSWSAPLPLHSASGTGDWYWRPLPTWSMAALGGNHAAQHALNLALGLAWVAGVFSLALRALPERLRGGLPLFLACAPFCLHPAIVAEPVAWMAGRFDLCLSVFTIWALRASLWDDRRAPIAAGLLALCALLSKDNAPIYLAGVLLVSFLEVPRQRFRPLLAAVSAAGLAWFAARSQIAGLDPSGPAREALAIWAAHPRETISALALLCSTYAKEILSPWPAGALPEGGVAANLAGLAALFALMTPFRAFAFNRTPVSAALCAAAAPLLLTLFLMSPVRPDVDAATRYLMASSAFVAFALFRASALLSLPKTGSHAVVGAALLALSIGWAASSHAQAAAWLGAGPFWQAQSQRFPSAVQPDFMVARTLASMGEENGACLALSRLESKMAAASAGKTHVQPGFSGEVAALRAETRCDR